MGTGLFISSNQNNKFSTTNMNQPTQVLKTNHILVPTTTTTVGMNYSNSTTRVLVNPSTNMNNFNKQAIGSTLQQQPTTINYTSGNKYFLWLRVLFYLFMMFLIFFSFYNDIRQESKWCFYLRKKDTANFLINWSKFYNSKILSKKHFFFPFVSIHFDYILIRTKKIFNFIRNKDENVH